MNRLTKLEILNEIVDFYSTDTNRRSLNEGSSCVYNGPSGNHCAVGRCLLPVYHEMGEDLAGNDDDINTLIELNNNNSLDEMLQEQYRGHELSFWTKLQLFHDAPENWDSGITTEGEFDVNTIIKLFKLK